MPERVSAYERLREIADQIENDRREPDKVLCAVQNLRRLASDWEAGHEMVKALREHRTRLSDDAGVPFSREGLWP